MSGDDLGRILAGPADGLKAAYAAFERQAVDWDLSGEPPDPSDRFQTTLASPASVGGLGTFFGKASRTLTFLPSARPGWWFDRADLADSLPFEVSVRNVWTTVRNIVLHCGSPHNYMRMVEHIIALKLGLGLDNVVVRVDSGDPPLFDRGSLDIVEAVEKAGLVPQTAPARYLTVKEPVSLVGPGGSFLIVRPCRRSQPVLFMDSAVDFPNAMGRQRIRLTLNKRWFRHGAPARTNTTAAMKLFCHTFGKLFADVRHLGYTDRNLVIAGKHRYWNEVRLVHEGKALEVIWHRTVLDLLAALGLIDGGRFVGDVLSYKAGHALDCRLVLLLFKHDLLEEFQ